MPFEIQCHVEPVIIMSPAEMTVGPNRSQIKFGRYEFQKMGRIGSTEMYLIWEQFGPAVISARLIIITGSSFDKAHLLH